MDFISTGVILKTSYGQRLPVVVTYRGLAGQISIDADVRPEDNIADKEMAEHTSDDNTDELI